MHCWTSPDPTVLRALMMKETWQRTASVSVQWNMWYMWYMWYMAAKKDQVAGTQNHRPRWPQLLSDTHKDRPQALSVAIPARGQWLGWDLDKRIKNHYGAATAGWGGHVKELNMFYVHKMIGRGNMLNSCKCWKEDNHFRPIWGDVD